MKLKNLFMKHKRPALWYMQEDPSMLQKALLEYNDNIALQQVSYVERCRAYMENYCERKISGFDGNAWMDYAMRDSPECNENIFRSVVDTFVANYAANQPRVEFISKSGDWQLIRKAIGLTKAVEGIFQTASAYAVGRQTMRDGGLFGTACVKIYPDNGNKCVAIERVVVPSEIRIDFLDGKFGKPRNLIQHKIIPREAAYAYAEANELDTTIIDGAGLMTSDNYADSFARTRQDPISIVEAWHLPSFKDSGDGRHAIALSSGLLGEPDGWEQSFFPFVFFKYKPSVIGFWGEGIGDDITGLRNGYNFMNEKLQRLLNMSTTRCWLPIGSNVTSEYINNNPDYAIARFSGPQPPVFAPDPSPTPALFQERERFKQSMYEMSGISQMNAAALHPAGLDSGRAQRVYQDIISKRFADVSLSIDEFWVEMAARVCWAGSQLDGVMVKYTDKQSRVIDEIKWSEVAMEPNEYAIERRAASQLSDEPAGRRQDIADLMAQFPQLSVMFAKLFKDPDVDFALSMLTAPLDMVTNDIERIENGEQVTPEPDTSPQIGIPLVLARLSKIKTMKAPVDIVDNLMTYLSELVALQTAANQPGVGAGAVMGTNQQFTGAPPAPGTPMNGAPTGGQPLPM